MTTATVVRADGSAVGQRSYDPLARARSASNHWLRYQPPDQESAAAAKVAFYGERRAGQAEFAPILALREAQMYHAAKKLPELERVAAFARREYPNRSQVTYILYRYHRAEWRAFMARHPVQPFAHLMRQCAQLMAEVLGEDFF